MPGEAKPNSVTENTASLALDLSRRDFVATASATAGGFALAQGSAGAATVGTDIANLTALWQQHTAAGHPVTLHRQR